MGVNSLRVDPNQVLFNRIKAVKPKLKKGFKQKFFEKHPDYNNSQGVNLLNNVLTCRSSCVKLTQLLEDFANSIENI
jgi:hypothetical protein